MRRTLSFIALLQFSSTLVGYSPLGEAAKFGGAYTALSDYRYKKL